MDSLDKLPDSTRKTLIVAELSSNHSGDLDKAKALIATAAWAGATAVKLQFFHPEQMTLKSNDPEFVIKEGPWRGTLWDLYEKAQTPVEWAKTLLDLARSLNLGCIASVYHPDMLGELEGLDFDAWKIASFEIAYLDLLQNVAQTGRPVLVSTGCATFSEIERAVTIIGREKIALLKCTSAYPAKIKDMNLATIPDLMQKFQCPVGLSDHSTGIVASVTAVALGASLIERHLKLDNDCLDAAFSIDPKQFRAMVTTIRAAEAAIGKVSYEPVSTKFKRREVNGQWVRTVH